MEPEALSAESSAQALAVLCAIPLVIFALWADYFGRDLEALNQNKPKYEREPELEKIRIASLLGLLVQFMLFLGSSEIRGTHPLFTNSVFLLAILMQLVVQSRLEKQIRPEKPSKDLTHTDSPPEEIGKIVLKTILSWTLGLTAQLFLLFISVRMSLSFCAWLTLGPTPTALIALSAGILAIATGLTLNYALGPAYLKQVLPNQPLEDPTLRHFLSQCFERAALPLPTLAVIELSKFKITSLIWTGVQKGSGFLKPILFISRWMFSALSRSELEAIVLNHLAHIRLKNPEKKFILTMVLIIITTATALAAVFATEFAFPSQGVSEIVGPIVALFAFFACFQILSHSARRLEFNADTYTVENLGVSAKDLINALLKVDQNLEPDSNDSVLVHPQTLLRIQALRNRYENEKGVIELLEEMEYFTGPYTGEPFPFISPLNVSANKKENLARAEPEKKTADRKHNPANDEDSDDNQNSGKKAA